LVRLKPHSFKTDRIWEFPVQSAGSRALSHGTAGRNGLMARQCRKWP